MKTQFFLFVTILLIVCPVLTNAQQDFGTDSVVQSKENKFDSQKGDFHIAIQNFAFGEIYESNNSYSLSTRVGYMITNHDMIFLDGQFSWNPRHQVDKTIEIGLNYRRYFGNSAFQPFVQSGIGLGHISYTEDSYSNSSRTFYGVVDFGTGVSFRYKRWKFEVGIQTEFNHNYTGRIYLKPLFGISFTF